MSVLVRTGRVIRFDETRGYGFIAPDGGGEDVFVHANELAGDESQLTSGTVVEFESMESDRGLKAFGVRVLSRPGPGKSSPPIGDSSPALLDDDGLCDVLAPSEFQEDLTEVLLTSNPGLTGVQIVRIRENLLTLATKHGWVQSGATPPAG